MTLRVTFELDEDDLRHFRLIMREARKAAQGRSPEDIVAAAEQLLASAHGAPEGVGATQDGNARAPGFILDRLSRLRLLIDMLSDVEWRLPNPEAVRVLNALAYFAEPEDLIPDHIPGLGFLDDAIMIELVTRELKHEMEAYEDFCSFRDRIRRESGRGKVVRREDWLEERRKELQTRMRRRRKRSDQSAGGQSGINLFK